MTTFLKLTNRMYDCPGLPLTPKNQKNPLDKLQLTFVFRLQAQTEKRNTVFNGGIIFSGYPQNF